MREFVGDICELLDSNSAVCILTNNTVTGPGTNIMGAGIAKEARDRNNNLEYTCGLSIKNNTFSLGFDSITKAEMLRFPTKDNVWKDSDVNVIADSLSKLKDYCIKNPMKKVYLPRPGCGCGGLNWERDVKPICETYLKDIKNVCIVSK